MTPIQFARTLRNTRVEAGLTQAAFGHRVSIDAMLISRWERGLVIPSPNSWAKLRKAFPNIFPRDERPIAPRRVPPSLAARAKAAEAST